MTAMVVLFVLSVLLLSYVYFGYPALIWTLAKLRPRGAAKADITPSMTLIIPVHNEEQTIELKIRNSLATNYPNLELLIVNDGSTDNTSAIVKAHAEASLIEIPRAGKAAALNAGAAAAKGEILAFTDANIALHPAALHTLARSFADPHIGGVAGKKITRETAQPRDRATGSSEGLYWRYEQWQKQLESTFGSVYTADGALYAIRRALYVPIEDPAQADDIAISTRVVLQGHRLLFEPDALAYEDAPVEGADELRRKIRVTNHSVRALLNLGSRLWLSGFYSVELLSHKLLRHFAGAFLVLLLLANVWLARRPPFGVFLAMQIAFYSLAVAGAALRHRKMGSLKIFSVPYYFCLVNAAALLGVLSIARGRRVKAWSPRGN